MPAMVPARRLLTAAAIVLLAVPAVAVARPAPDVDPSVSPVVQMVGSTLVTLVVGGIVLAVRPAYARTVVERIYDDGFAALGVGVLALIVFVGVELLLWITIVGILLAIPLAIAFAVVGAIGNALGYLAIFGALVESRWTALVLAAALSGVVGVIPILGDLVGFLIGSIGVGAVFLEWLW